jgi:hypothetical protein
MEHLMEVSTTRITAIVGATISANLLLLALDMASASQPVRCAVEGNRTERPVVLQAEVDLS